MLAVVAGIVAFFLTVMRDTLLFGKIRNLIELLQMLINLKTHSYFMNGKVWSYVDHFEHLVDSHPDVIQFIFVENDEHVSRSGLERRANQIAHWARDLKHPVLKQKDTVALMMLNKPDYVPFWLGLSKVGVRTALLNTNMLGKAFLHSVSVSFADSTSKVLVVDEELCLQLKDELKELRTQLGVTVFIWDEVSKHITVMPTDRPSKQFRNTVKESDPFLYIFTSGTTGLPKASKISHSRYKLAATPMQVTCYLKPGDRVYNSLPLYHSAGGMVGVGGVLQSGATLVIR